MSVESWCLLGTPLAGGVLVVADHASPRVPDDIALGIEPGLLGTHIAVDLGVAGVAQHLVEAGAAAFCGQVSRLVCDFNRDEDDAGVVPRSSDGIAIAGNGLDADAHATRIARFHRPYHHALADLLAAHPPALILSLHSFTPQLATAPEQARPWQVGVLYNRDRRAAGLALDWLRDPALVWAELVVGDQLPYSGELLNATMNRHAEAHGRAYVGIELRQDQIADGAGQRAWGERLSRLARHLAEAPLAPGGRLG